MIRPSARAALDQMISGMLDQIAWTYGGAFVPTIAIRCTVDPDATEIVGGDDLSRVIEAVDRMRQDSRIKATTIIRDGETKQ